MSTDVTLSKSFIFQQLWKHPIIYMPCYMSDPLKSKAWTYHWMVMFFIRSNINEHDVQSCFLLWCGWSNSGRSCEKHCLSEFSNRTPACYSSAVNPSYGFATSDSIRQFRCTTVGLVGCSTGCPLYRGQWSDMRSAVDWWLAHRWFWSGGWWNFRNRPRLSNRVWRGRGLEWCCFPLLETRGGSVA